MLIVLCPELYATRRVQPLVSTITHHWCRHADNEQEYESRCMLADLNLMCTSEEALVAILHPLFGLHDDIIIIDNAHGTQ